MDVGVKLSSGLFKYNYLICIVYCASFSYLSFAECSYQGISAELSEISQSYTDSNKQSSLFSFSSALVAKKDLINRPIFIDDVPIKFLQKMICQQLTAAGFKQLRFKQFEAPSVEVTALTLLNMLKNKQLNVADNIYFIAEEPFEGALSQFESQRRSVKAAHDLPVDNSLLIFQSESIQKQARVFKQEYVYLSNFTTLIDEQDRQLEIHFKHISPSQKYQCRG